MGFGVIVLGYIGLLYFGATIVPGVGLAGYLMVLVPGNLLEWAHAPGYGILAVLVTLGLQRRAWPLAYALPVAAAAALVFGLWTEVFQGSVQGRGASVDDLVTDAVGIGLAMLFQFAIESVIMWPWFPPEEDHGAKGGRGRSTGSGMGVVADGEDRR